MLRPKTRQIIYRKASWFIPGMAPRSLDQLLARVLENLPNIEDKRIDHGDGRIAEIRHQRISNSGSVYLHLAGYVPDEEAVVIPHVQGVAEADLDTSTAPDGSDFVNGEAMLRVSGNHILLCTSGMREAFVASYLRGLCRAGGASPEDASFEMLRVANRNIAHQLAHEGVKKVDLGVSLAGAEFEEIDRMTARQSLRGELGQWLRDMVGPDRGAEEFQAAERIRANVTLSFDRGRTPIEPGRLVELAHRLVEQEPEGFVIETRKGERITAEDVNIKKIVHFAAHGNSIRFNDAWREIDIYFDEIGRHGLLG